MRRPQLIRHLEACGCEMLREGARHTLYLNRDPGLLETLALVREITKEMEAREGSHPIGKAA